MSREKRVNVKAACRPRCCPRLRRCDVDGGRCLQGPRHGDRRGRPGFATLAMNVRPDMVNGQRIAHGGFIFTLADSAFAFACNRP